MGQTAHLDIRQILSLFEVLFSHHTDYLQSRVQSNCALYLLYRGC